MSSAWIGLLVAVSLVHACSVSDSTTTMPPTTIAAATPTTAPHREDTAMQLTSTAFSEGGAIPVRFTCDGDDISPPLVLTGVPDGAAALVLIMDDPDAPNGTWDHWVAYDIPVTDEIAENVGSVGTAGTNSWGRTGYGGPCPPSGTHRYFFRVLATSVALGLAPGATKQEVLAAAAPITLAEASLMATYAR